MSNKELINVLLEVFRHSDTLMQYVHVDHYDDIGDDHDRIIRLVNDTVAKFEEKISDLVNLREQIQEDIIACCCACDHNLEDSELIDNLCQIVVDRINGEIEDA